VWGASGHGIFVLTTEDEGCKVMTRLSVSLDSLQCYNKKAFSCSSRHHACKAGSKQADDRVQLVHGRIWEQSIKQSLKRILSLFNELLVCYLHHTLSHQSTGLVHFPIPTQNISSVTRHIESLDAYMEH
jgi:hypothetical protein